MCTSFNFERNIVFQPHGANSTFVGFGWTAFEHTFDNFTFARNIYYAEGKPTDEPHMFNGTGRGDG